MTTGWLLGAGCFWRDDYQGHHVEFYKCKIEPDEPNAHPASHPATGHEDQKWPRSPIQGGSSTSSSNSRAAVVPSTQHPQSLPTSPPSQGLPPTQQSPDISKSSSTSRVVPVAQQTQTSQAQQQLGLPSPLGSQLPNAAQGMQLSKAQQHSQNSFPYGDRKFVSGQQLSTPLPASSMGASAPKPATWMYKIHTPIQTKLITNCCCNSYQGNNSNAVVFFKLEFSQLANTYMVCTKPYTIKYFSRSSATYTYTWEHDISNLIYLPRSRIMYTLSKFKSSTEIILSIV